MTPFKMTRTVIKAGTLSMVLFSLILVNAGCQRDAVEEPGPPTGPSGGTYYINIYASPSVLPSNTKQTSTITAILRKYDGSPVANQPLRFEITDGSLGQINLGSLSTKSGVTDNDGVARTIYTVPKADVEGFIYVRATWTTSPWTERYFSLIPLSLRFKQGPPVVNQYPTATFTIVTPGPYDVNQEITFDGKASFDPDGVIFKWIWDFGDKKTVVNFETMDNDSPMLNQPIVTHKFKLAGSYVVTLKVVDDLGAYDVDQQVILVGSTAGTAPTACYVITTPLPVSGSYDPDTDIIFDGTCSTDPDGAIRRYDWDWGDGKYSYNGGRILTHRWHQIGAYAVTLTVTDDSGLKGVVSQNVLVGIGGQPASPTAAFSFAPDTPDIGGEVVFDATGSTDSDGVITAYHWVFGDGSESSAGPIAYHSYNQAGDYFVILTVTDDDGYQGVATAMVPVAGGGSTNPVACFGYTGGGKVGDIMKFDGTCSSDSDGQIRGWRWDLGDGVVDTTSGPIVTHAYGKAGTYYVFLTVTDDDGWTGVTSATLTITAGNAPVADAGSDQNFPSIGACVATPTQTVAFSGASSTDSDGSIVSYRWDFGDGTSSGSLAVSSTTHTYTISATTTFTVTLTVTDDDGMTDTDTCQVTIACT